MATILLVSDLASLRGELTSTLASPERTIEEAANGPDAVARVVAGGIDLVVADLQVGAMGAIAITRELRNLESYGGADSVAVLLLLDRRADVFLARRAAADGFVVKPLDSQRLRAAVRALLRGEEYDDDTWRPMTVRAGALDRQ